MTNYPKFGVNAMKTRCQPPKYYKKLTQSTIESAKRCMSRRDSTSEKADFQNQMVDQQLQNMSLDGPMFISDGRRVASQHMRTRPSKTITVRASMPLPSTAGDYRQNQLPATSRPNYKSQKRFNLLHNLRNTMKSLESSMAIKTNLDSYEL